MSVAMFAFPSLSQANVIQNGDFATGDLTGWTLTFTQYGIPGIAPVVVPFDVTGTGTSNAAEFQVGVIGPHVGTGQQGLGLLQPIITGSGLYTFSAAIAVFDNSYPNSDAGNFTVILDVQPEVTYSFGQIATGETLRSSLSFTAEVSAGQHYIEILITRGFNIPGGLYQYVTDISFDTPSLATPLPAALPLFASGLAGLGLLGWRRKKAAAG